MFYIFGRNYFNSNKQRASLFTTNLEDRNNNCKIKGIPENCLKYAYMNAVKTESETKMNIRPGREHMAYWNSSMLR